MSPVDEVLTVPVEHVPPVSELRTDAVKHLSTLSVPWEAVDK
jgi:hypothetical protein